jgi:hypothetical protein
MSGRGVLTHEIRLLSKELLGYEITQSDLRLMPYIQYVMMNEQKINPAHISGDERKILSFWRKQGFMEGGASGLSITKHFWDGINQILWLAYVNLQQPTEH